MEKRSPDRRPTHPGEFLREVVLPDCGVTMGQLAAALGVSRQTLSAIVNERSRVEAVMAVRLGRLFGNSPMFWMNMQNAVDIFDAERRPDVQDVRELQFA